MSDAPLIVFDLDGTLIDTAPDLLHSLNHVLVEEGLAEVDKAKLRKFVGFGGRVMIENAYADANEYLAEDTLDRLVKEFVAHYADNMPGQSKPFSGLENCLSLLEDAGCHFAICTNKTEMLSHKLIDALGMTHQFKANCGQDSFSVRKPHPDHLLKTIELAGGMPKNAIMVGDTPTDFSTAKAANIPLIAVDFGYCDEDVARYEPNIVLSHYDDLKVQMVEALLK